MIIHSYFTEGYFPWAKLFVKSFKQSNGDGYKMILSTRNLDQKRIDILKGMYDDVTVINKDLDYGQLAKRAKIPKAQLLAFKNETEKIKINMKNKIWKLLISAEDRIKEIKEVHDSLEDGELMLNFDVDSYIRKPIDPWIEIIKNNDFTSIFRIEKQIRKFGKVPHNRRQHAICCCVQGYNVGEKSRKLLDLWVKEIDSVPPTKRTKGFGQISLYDVYVRIKDELKWGDLPKNQFSLTGQGKQNILWGANKGAKNDNLRAFKQEFKQRTGMGI
jgi:hypothetical protein